MKGILHHGFKVDTFIDPQEALSNYKPGYYDLVILDIKMPKMDWFQLHDEIKKIDHSLLIFPVEFSGLSL